MASALRKTPLQLLRETTEPRIAVVRALVLGDWLVAIPAIRALRRALPHANITLVGLPWCEQFAARYRHLFDDFLHLPGMPGLVEQPFRIAPAARFLRESRRREFDLVIQMHGSGSFINDVVARMGAKRVAGFYKHEKESLNDQTFLKYPEHEHEIWRHLRLMEHLGVEPAGDELEFPLFAEDFADLLKAIGHDRLMAEAWSSGDYVCLHPGARYQSRRWPIDRFAAVGRALAGHGLLPVITGSNDELVLAAKLSEQLACPHVSLAGRTNLGAMAALVSRARLVITNDTGASHLCCAVGAPSVVIGLGSDPRRWWPLDRWRHPVVSHAVPCQPCEHPDCPLDFGCALGLSPSAVIATALDLLERTSGGTRRRQTPRGVSPIDSIAGKEALCAG